MPTDLRKAPSFGGAFLHAWEVLMVDLSVDLTVTYWTVEEAAEAAQVSPNVIRNWKYRGRLVEARRDWRGKPLFLAIDVVRAEKATRERARRVYPLAA